MGFQLATPPLAIVRDSAMDSTVVTQPKTVAVLGSTGSIGTQVLQVLAQFPQYFTVVGLAAGANHGLLAQQVAAFQPSCVSMGSKQALSTMAQAFSTPPWQQALSGPTALDTLIETCQPDIVIVGLVGIAGLAPTLKALQQGCIVLTANKETFVTGGHLVAPYLSQLITIDSEHSAILQCLKRETSQSIQQLILTASGGPFRGFTAEQLQTVTVAQALKHPNWNMGPKITIDCATLMNKGLEVIEAHWLFGVPYPQIQVVVHPQSIVHSGVAFVDGSVLLQAGVPDMRCPIRFALSQALGPDLALGLSPSRLPETDPEAHLNLLTMPPLTFQAPDTETFPCLQLARQAGEKGPEATIVLNAADEVVVEAVIKGQLPFQAIPTCIEKALDWAGSQTFETDTLSNVIALDRATRDWVQKKTLA
jgi:1-deoxy-D-xylulose-5-phosphate reductoisomerase